MIKGIIFDADGTIIDSMKIWDELGKRYLLKKGIRADSELSDILYDMSLEESGRYLKERYQISDRVEKIISDVLELIKDFYKNEVCEKPGLSVFLEKMKEKRIPMGIATSGSRELLQYALKKIGILEYFDFILTCDELGTSKKEPYIYLKAAKKLGTMPCETAVFEDAVHGIKTAGKVGFVTVGVRDESSDRYREEIIKTADIYITDFYDEAEERLFSKDWRKSYEINI